MEGLVFLVVIVVFSIFVVSSAKPKSGPPNPIWFRISKKNSHFLTGAFKVL